MDRTVAHLSLPDDRPASPSAHIDLTIGGMTCRHCPPLVEKALAGVDGVSAAHVNLSTGTAAIDYDSDRTSVSDLIEAIRSAGYSPGTAKTRLPIANMHCSSCVTRIEGALDKTPGVVAASASLGPNAVDVEYQPEITDFQSIRRAIESAGHKVAEPGPAEVKAAVEDDTDPEEAARDREYRTLMRKFWFAAAVSIPVMGLSYPDLIPGLSDWMPAGSDTRQIVWALLGVLTLPVLLWSGSQFFSGMWDGLKHRSANMHTLIAIGITAAYLYSAVAVAYPDMFPSVELAEVFWDVTAVVVALVVLGLALELKATRTDPNDFDAVRPESELETLRKAGYFIDLWQWRSSRSNPIALGDDGYVAEERTGDAGTGPYFTNWDEATGQPRFMFDPARSGKTALNIDDVVGGKIGFDDVYYLSPDTAVPFDPNLQWKNGDTLPRRVLRAESGSRADVVQPAAARWVDGYWDVTLVRKMDTGNPLDDKIFRDGGSYDLAFAVFRNASTMRWHYISLPVSLGLGQPAQLVAEKFEGGAPDWDQPWTEIEMFYPGQVSWSRLTDPRKHPGAQKIAERVPVAYRHNEQQLALYGIEVEFADEIRRQWLWTLVASLGLIVGLGINVNLLMRRREDRS